MKDGWIRCPLCTRAVELTARGLMKNHYSDLGRPGKGFGSLANKCKGSHKRPEDVK